MHRLLSFVERSLPQRQRYFPHKLPHYPSLRPPPFPNKNSGFPNFYGVRNSSRKRLTKSSLMRFSASAS